MEKFNRSLLLSAKGVSCLWLVAITLVCVFSTTITASDEDTLRLVESQTLLSVLADSNIHVLDSMYDKSEMTAYATSLLIAVRRAALLPDQQGLDLLEDVIPYTEMRASTYMRLDGILNCITSPTVPALTQVYGIYGFYKPEIFCKLAETRPSTMARVVTFLAIGAMYYASFYPEDMLIELLTKQPEAFLQSLESIDLDLRNSMYGAIEELGDQEALRRAKAQLTPDQLERYNKYIGSLR